MFVTYFDTYIADIVSPFKGSSKNANIDKESVKKKIVRALYLIGKDNCL